MSNYTIVTNFVAKDSLVSGNPLKLVKGADLTTEFTAVQSAVNSKVDWAASGASIALGGTTDQGTGTLNTTGLYVNNGPIALGVHKPTATSRASTTTVTADPALALSLPAGSYVARVYGYCGGGPGIQGGLYCTGTVTGSTVNGSSMGSIGPYTQTTGQGLNGSFTILASSSQTGSWFLYEACFTISTAGVLSFNWAQSNSSTTATILNAWSYLTATAVA